MFVPGASNILACFQDDTLHVWKYGSFESLKQILPAIWNKYVIKTVAFTRFVGKAICFVFCNVFVFAVLLFW